MSNAETIDHLLADLKRRFVLGTLTYAEAVVVEDLLAMVPQVNSEADQSLARCVAETSSHNSGSGVA